MRDVFISYNHIDAAIKEELCTILEREDLNYYVDSRDMQVGENIEQALYRFLRDARITLLIVSPTSLTSTWVQLESRFSLMKEQVDQTSMLICIMLDRDVLTPTYPLIVKERINNLITEYESLRDKMMALGGSTEVFDIELRRLRKIDVGELMDKVRNNLSVHFGDPATKEMEIARMVAAIKAVGKTKLAPPEVPLPAPITDGVPGPVDWDGLVRAIRQERAILFIGPELSVNFENPCNQAEFFQELALMHQGMGVNQIRGYDERDGLLIFNDHLRGRTAHQQAIRAFFSGITHTPRGFENTVLDKLAEIPFNLVMSASPDEAYYNACIRKRSHPTKVIQKKNRLQILPIYPISGKHPLIYQLFGSVEDAQHIVLGHEDIYNLIESAYREDCLEKVTNAAFPLEPFTHVVFLGFDFDKWYFQLILQLLKIRDIWDRHAVNRTKLDSPIMTLYATHFQINFVTGSIPAFVDYLHSQFGKADLRLP